MQHEARATEIGYWDADRTRLATAANYWPSKTSETSLTGRGRSCVRRSHRRTAGGSLQLWQSMGLRASLLCSSPRRSTGWHQSPRSPAGRNSHHSDASAPAHCLCCQGREAAPVALMLLQCLRNAACCLSARNVLPNPWAPGPRPSVKRTLRNHPLLSRIALHA